MHRVIFMQHWSRLDQRVGDPCPVGRLGHATVCLNYGEDHPQIFTTGGYDGYDNLNDGWILDVQSGRWREVSSLTGTMFVNRVTALGPMQCTRFEILNLSSVHIGIFLYRASVATHDATY